MKDGYTKYVTDRLVTAVGAEAALLACRLVAFADDKGVAHVSNEYLCGIFGWSANTLRNYAKKLEVLQIWVRKPGTYRTIKTEWRKGANFAPFMTLKGCKNRAEKGANFEPLLHNNKEKKKECAYAPARENGAAQRGKKKEAARLYYNGDTSLQPHDIDRMTKLWYNGRLAYCEKEDVKQCLACGARIFKPTIN